MAAIDFFCSADDRHRVVLLVDLLERAGQPVLLRCEPAGEPTRPLLVACTRRAFREPWISALFTGGYAVVAIRLDDAPLPGPCQRVIDMQAWPARSADRNVGTLVHWLHHGGADPSVRQRRRDRDRPGESGADAAARPRRSPAKRPLPDPNRLGGFALLGLLVLGGVLLSTLAERASRPEQDGATPRGEFPPLQLASPQHPGPDAAPSDRAVTGAATGGGADAAAAMSSRPAGIVTPEPHDALPRRAADTTVPPPDAAPPPAPHPDALQHLCDARSLTAARAWAGALSWKQRRRLADEPCITRLLGRPGFEPLTRLLDLSSA